MARVNDKDDSIWRWVIHHYRFDPDRDERRNVVVAAFDNEREFRAEFERYAEAIDREIASGNRSSRENVSGVALEPGHISAAARGHNVRRAIEHGVNPTRLLQSGPLPSTMAVFTTSVETSPTDDD